MKGLFVKDFRLMLQRKRFFLLLMLVALTMTFYSEGTGMIAYLILISVLFSVSTMSYDEYDNSYTFLMTLPIKRETYVQEKYLLGWGLGFIAWLVGSLLYIIVRTMNPMESSPFDTCIQALAFIPAGVLINDITFPFQLKYGMERGRLAMIVTFGLIAGIFYSIQKVMAINTSGAIYGAMEFVKGNTVVAVLLAYSLVLVITYVSYRISVQIMKKKEL